MKTIALLVVLFLALYGAVDLVERLAYRFLFSADMPIYCVIPLRNQQEAEFFIRQSVAERKRLPCRYEWVLVDCGLSEEGRTIAEPLCRELHIPFYQKNDFFDFLCVGLQEE